VSSSITDAGSGATAGPDPPAAVDRSEWSLPRPEALPRPTYWPATLAFGAAVTLFGIVTSLILSGMGIALLVLAIVMWIGEIRDEQHD
jgi:hypothetical protein